MEIEPCDLFKKIPRYLIDDIFAKCPEVSAEMDCTFLGFEEVYQRVAWETPKNMRIVDFGCCYAFQSWYFKDYAGYIGVDNSTPIWSRLRTCNARHYYESIQNFIWKDRFSERWKKEAFAVCSYVPDEEARRMVVENFPNHYVFYPNIIDDWRLEYGKEKALCI